MYRHALILAALCSFSVSTAPTQAKSNDNAATSAGVPAITITKVDIDEKILKLRYEIRNESDKDIWILGGFAESGYSFDVFIDKDGRTLLMQRRFDVPAGGGDVVDGRYVLIRPGDTQIESVTLALPICPEYGLAYGRTGQLPSQKLATRLAVEVGYYPSNLPDKIRRTLEEVDRIGMKPRNDDDRTRFSYFKGSLHFNGLQETLTQRNEEILLPYTHQWFTGEQVLRTVAEDVRIPYEERDEHRTSRRNSLDIPPCTRVEIQYRPSMLGYFFPYVDQQNLLSLAEKWSLQSGKTVVVQDIKDLTTFVNDINKGVPTNGVVRERFMAQVACYKDDKYLTSFPIYNDDSIVADFRDRFTYNDDVLHLSLRMLTPQIEPFELRTQCAANLRNLWHRFRLYYKAAGEIEMLYPAAADWCDAMVPTYTNTGMSYESVIKTHICPSARAGKSHYAMNTNCRHDSPSDMVLLFETKAGWNQHGGPELFTFDNHDPKGGCVLLNDGTVRFIRTQEELQQLRWK